MDCIECGAEMPPPQPERVPYVCGLPEVYIENAPVYRCPRCGNYEVSINNVEALHEALVQCVLGIRRPFLGAEIRFLRKARGWSSQDTATRMRVKPPTMSRWENGTQRMSDSMEAFFRLLIREATVATVYDDLPCDDDEGVPRPIRVRLEGDAWCQAAK